MTQSYYSRPCIIAKGDSGAISYYFRMKDMTCLANVRANTTLKVHQPDGTTLKQVAAGHLPLSDQLSCNAKEAAVLPQLHTSLLISLGKLCDDDCDVHLTKTDLVATKNNKVVLQGHSQS